MNTMDVSQIDFASLVREAKESGTGVAWLGQLRAQFDLRHRRRKQKKIPVVAFVGHGRAGKDTAAKIYSQISRPRAIYGGSTSEVVNPLIALSLEMTPDECWRTRHDNRMFWKAWCNEFRREDPTALVRMILARGDIVVGTRSFVELSAGVMKGLIDWVAWIAKDGVPKDPTMDYDFEDVATLPRSSFLTNNGTEAELEPTIKTFAQLITGLC